MILLFQFHLENHLDRFEKYLSFPVFNGMAEYTEYYEILPDELDAIMNNEAFRKRVLAKSRNRQNDDRLLFKPGRMRGSPC